VLPGLIFIHGGGWWLGTLDDGDAYCRQRATGLDCVVMAIDYRLAPEHPFPLPLDDCWAATQWIFEHADELGVDPSRVAISGGSAGANLAAAVTLLAREHGGAPFVAQLLEVPATDLTMEVGRGSIEEFAEGFVLSKADLIECAEFYLGGHDPRDPLASPYFADLHDLPPALVMTCECDPVRDDGEAYAGRLAEAGVPTVMRRWEGMVHGSAELAVIVPDVAEAYTAEVHAFLSRQFSARTV
jgi:acetyl esterase